MLKNDQKKKRTKVITKNILKSISILIVQTQNYALFIKIALLSGT